MSLKNPVTPPGIDPGTVRLVAQRLSHYATPLLYVENENVKQQLCSVVRFLMVGQKDQKHVGVDVS